MLRAVVLAAIAGAPQPSVTPVVPIVIARLLNRTLRYGYRKVIRMGLLPMAGSYVGSLAGNFRGITLFVCSWLLRAAGSTIPVFPSP